MITIPGSYGPPNERVVCESLLKHKWVKHNIYGKGYVLSIDIYRFMVLVNFSAGRFSTGPELREIFWDELQKYFPNYNDIWNNVNG